MIWYMWSMFGVHTILVCGGKIWEEEAEEEVGRGFKHCRMSLATALGRPMNDGVHLRVHRGW